MAINLNELGQRLKELFPDHTGPLTPEQRNTAMETLRAETVEERVTTNMTLLQVSSRLGMSTAAALYANVDGASTDNPWLYLLKNLWEHDGNTQIDINHPDAHAVLDQLAAEEGNDFDEDTAQAIKDLALRERPAWPGLTLKRIDRAWEIA